MNLSPIHKIEHRKNQHKQDLDEEKLKKGRRSDQVSVRKRKRNEHLLKRRNISTEKIGEELPQAVNDNNLRYIKQII